MGWGCSGEQHKERSGASKEIQQSDWQPTRGQPIAAVTGRDTRFSNRAAHNLRTRYDRRKNLGGGWGTGVCVAYVCLEGRRGCEAL